MSKKYKLVRTLPEMVDMVNEVCHNTDALRRRTRWLTVGLVVCGVELLLASRLITKQEEAICDLTRQVNELTADSLRMGGSKQSLEMNDDTESAER